jgi:2-octaprenyl-6-methoxyphenol hydroxylase
MVALSGMQDIVIVGGGVVGLTLALGVARTFSGEVGITVVAPAGSGEAFGSSRDAARATAVSAGTRAALDVLGVWPAIAAVAQPVARIDLTESALEAGVRPVLLSYDPITADGQPTLWIVPNVELYRAIEEAAAHEPAIVRRVGSATGLAADMAAARGINLADGSSLMARLVIAADGRRSRLREAAGIRTLAWPYPQSAIVTKVRLSSPHHGVATQHFLPAGPFAILPMTDDHACITWSEASETAQHLVAGDDATFKAALEQRCGAVIGPLDLAGPRDVWPLDMHLARAFTADRVALVGDSAHGVHPIAGQGLNLSFRDIAALVECLADGLRAGLDAGDPMILARYQRWRGFDTALSAASFDAINRLFSNDWRLVRSAREAGLGLVDRLPILKRALVAEAAGLTGDVPKLLRGQLP